MKNTPEARIVGTAFWNHTVTASFNQLVERFGLPAVNDSEGEKVHVQWHLTDDAGNVLTVYDWRESVNPSQYPTTPFKWHVGGKSAAVTSQIGTR